MSTVIKGLSMPKNCLLCPCCVGEGIGAGRQHYCQAIDDEPYVSETYRPKNCPLIEIPTPHGDLVDRDDLTDEINRVTFAERYDYNVAYNIVTDADTIIEAEVSE